jgi:type IV secretion system protein TrbI
MNEENEDKKNTNAQSFDLPQDTQDDVSFASEEDISGELPEEEEEVIEDDGMLQDGGNPTDAAPDLNGDSEIPEPESFPEDTFTAAVQEAKKELGTGEDTEGIPPDDGGSFPGGNGDTVSPDGGRENGEDTVKPFIPETKKTYDDVSKKQPPKLNKPLIVKILAALGILVTVLLVFQPSGCQQKKKTAKVKEKAQDVTMGDYESMAPAGGYSKETPSGTPSSSDSPTSPPTNSDYTYKPDDSSQVQEKNSSSGSYHTSVASGGSERPDTRADSMQVSISGIKGLSGSRKNYATDYDATVEKNAESAADSDNRLAKYGLPDKSELTNSILSQYSSSQSGSNDYVNQNDQSGKNKFHTSNSASSGGQYLPANSIWEGTIFEAELKSAINTDNPGEITAIVTKNIYSSQDGKYLLIPQNSKLIGSYNSSISYSQSRAQVGWYTCIRPDGYRITLGNFNGTDSHGASGITGWVNDHPMAYVKAIGLMSAFNIVNSQFQSTADSTDNEYVQNVMANSQEVATTLGNKLIDRAMNVQPTINIHAGTIIKVFCNQTLTLPPCEDYPVTQQYRKGSK